jgi:hypothetical protein
MPSNDLSSLSLVMLALISPAHGTRSAKNGALLVWKMNSVINCPLAQAGTLELVFGLWMVG